jgi:hypothetical protein
MQEAVERQCQIADDVPDAWELAKRENDAGGFRLNGIRQNPGAA